MLRKSSLVLFTLLAGQLVAAKPAAVQGPTKAQVFTVKGMHCEACVSAITKKVCTEGTYASCSVVLTDESKQLGEIRITPKEGQTIDTAKLKTAVSDIGYELK